MTTVSASDDWRTRLERQRERKDRFLRENPRSPLPEAHGDDFDGLAYFPPNPALRFELDLREHDDPGRLTVGTTTGGDRTYLRTGEFRFAVDGEDCTLQAYRSGPDEDRLWVPFRDETNGAETYGGGRYLDLEPDDRVDGRWVVDFNRAYNPSCVYDDAYECPMVPTENWLDVRIEAGEMLPDLPGEH